MKERLTGAIILVAVLVLLVPELLSGPNRSARNAESAANADGAQMRSYTIDLADDAHHDGSAPVTETPTNPTETPASGDATPQSATPDAPAEQTEQSSESATSSAAPELSAQAVPATPQVETPQPAPRPNESTTRSGASGARPQASVDAGWGSEGSRASGAAGVGPRNSVPPAETSASGTRAPAARTEPDSRAPSSKPSEAASRLAAATPARAESPPTAKPAASTQSKSTSTAPTSGAWAFQVGSFASRENAERLARELKGKGFAATVSQSPKGKRLWRVRVGPEPDKAAATALGARLRAAGQSGAVVPYP